MRTENIIKNTSMASMRTEPMTRNEFYEKYGNIVVKFSSYYKFTFSFTAALPDGRALMCHYGGSYDEIYRFSLENDQEIAVKDLSPYAGYITMDGKEIESFNEY